jgi:hypothetical protein
VPFLYDGCQPDQGYLQQAAAIGGRR